MNSTEKILCSKCKLYFGTIETKGFCSVCYKLEVKTVLPEVDVTNKFEENKEEIKKDEKIIPIQVNKDQCWKCQKKVGYLGFACKCKFIFCGIHRHFSEHNCDYDYKTNERERLRMENPLITSKKV